MQGVDIGAITAGVLGVGGALWTIFRGKGLGVTVNFGKSEKVRATDTPAGVVSWEDLTEHCASRHDVIFADIKQNNKDMNEAVTKIGEAVARIDERTLHLVRRGDH
jgi:hypothetical protein